MTSVQPCLTAHCWQTQPQQARCQGFIKMPSWVTQQDLLARICSPYAAITVLKEGVFLKIVLVKGGVVTAKSILCCYEEQGERFCNVNKQQMQQFMAEADFMLSMNVHTY